MNSNTLLLAICAGLISAVVFASATTGPVLLRAVLFFLTPLSIYLTGLGLGAAFAGIAAATATLAILLATNPAAAALYGLSEALPAVITTRLALLSRGTGETAEWYPIGRIVAAAALFGGLFSGFILILMGGDADALLKSVRGFVETFVKTELTQVPGAPTIADTQIDEIARTTLNMLPWALAVLSMSTILINLWLAGRITLASGRLARPWPDLAHLVFPPGTALVLVLAIAVSFSGGMAGLIAGGFSGGLTFAFVLLGLCVVHALTRGSPWRPFILATIYTAFLIFSPGISLLLALAGLAETIFGFRFHGGGPPSNTSK
jgi:hypothetical protein